MRRMMRALPRGRAVVFACTLAVGGAACRTASPPGTPGAANRATVGVVGAAVPLPLRPLAEARAASVGYVRVAPLVRVAREADELGRRLQLPVPLGAQVVTFATSAFAALGWRIDANDLAMAGIYWAMSFSSN